MQNGSTFDLLGNQVDGFRNMSTASIETGPASETGTPQSASSKASETGTIDTKGRIFVAKIPRSVTEDEFKEYFDTFGEVTDAYMPKDRTQRYYRGIGFVTYAEEESADRVMELKHSLHDHEVVVDYAIPPKKQQKEEKEAEAEKATKEAVAPESPKQSPVRQTPKVGQGFSFSNQLPVLHELSQPGKSAVGWTAGREEQPSGDSGLLPSLGSLAGMSIGISQPQPEFGSFGTGSYSGSYNGSFVDIPQSFLGYQQQQASPTLVSSPPLQCHHPQHQENSDLPPIGNLQDLEALMRTSPSLDFSLNGSLKHSHSFASTTDLSSIMFDSASTSDLLSTSGGAFSQESDMSFRHPPQQQQQQQQAQAQPEFATGIPTLSQENLLHAIRENTYASQLQELVALATMQKMAASTPGLAGGNSLQTLGMDMVSPAVGHGFDGSAGINHPSLGYPVANPAPVADFFPHTHAAAASLRQLQRGRPRMLAGRLQKGLGGSRDLSDQCNQFGPFLDMYMQRARDGTADHRGFVPFRAADSIEG